MTVAHPKEGAVYWEGPVTVELELTLIGEKHAVVGSRSPFRLRDTQHVLCYKGKA